MDLDHSQCFLIVLPTAMISVLLINSYLSRSLSLSVSVSLSLSISLSVCLGLSLSLFPQGSSHEKLNTFPSFRQRVVAVVGVLPIDERKTLRMNLNIILKK